MGIIIVTIIGAVMGWLAAIVVDRDDRSGTVLLAGAGLAGALASALAFRDVPLVVGVSAAQLLLSTAGALLAIVVMNVVAVGRTPARTGYV